MKITNNGISNASLKPSEEVSAPPPVAHEHETEVVRPESAAYVPSAQLLRIFNLVQQQPEVREERVQAARERLRRGDYLLPESAEQTADAMLRGAD